MNMSAKERGNRIIEEIERLIDYEQGAYGDLLEAFCNLERRNDRLVEVFNELISESEGVVGLHRKGDVVTWDWLLKNWDTPLREDNNE